MKTPALDPVVRRSLLDLAEKAIEHCANEQGEIDKEKAIEEMLGDLQRPAYALQLADIRAASLRFTVYEMLRWKIRNQRPDNHHEGSQFVEDREKGADGGGARKFVSIPRGKNRFAAIPVESLSEEDKQIVVDDYDQRIRALVRQRRRVVNAGASLESVSDETE